MTNLSQRPLKCCVVDDEPLAANLIASYIDRTPFLTNAGTFHTATDAIRAILHSDIELVFLDINMPGLSGLDIAHIISPHTHVIFITAYDNYALEGFRVNALDYLLKPVSYEEFLNSANKAMRIAPVWRSDADGNPEQHQGETVTPDKTRYPDHIIVKSEYKLIQIPVSSILYIEGLKDYVRIFSEDNDKGVMTLMSIKALEKSLPPDKFMRVHRSYIVNTDKIKVIERNRIVFGNTYIPVSESYRSSFSQYINNRAVPAQRGENSAEN